MLEKLFGSKSRVKLLTLLLTNPDQAFFVRELTRRLDERINSVRRELANLEKMGMVTSVEKNRKRYYIINQKFNYFPELRALFLKAGVSPDTRLIKQLKDVGKVSLAVLSGIFSRYQGAKADILIVGEVDKKKLEKIIKELEDDMSEEINYTVMSKDEFEYRAKMMDRFLRDVFDHDHTVAIDKIGWVESHAAATGFKTTPVGIGTAPVAE